MGVRSGSLGGDTSFLALNYFFVPPYYTLLVHRTQDFLVLIVFLGVSITIGQLVGRVSKSLAETTAREYEAIHLYELIMHLAGLQDEQEISFCPGRTDASSPCMVNGWTCWWKRKGGLPARHVRLEDRSQNGMEAEVSPTHIAAIAVDTWVPGRDQGLARGIQAHPGGGTPVKYICQPGCAGTGESAPVTSGFTGTPAGR